jgi:hypothetical protein
MCERLSELAQRSMLRNTKRDKQRTEVYDATQRIFFIRNYAVGFLAGIHVLTITVEATEPSVLVGRTQMRFPQSCGKIKPSAIRTTFIFICLYCPQTTLQRDEILPVVSLRN